MLSTVSLGTSLSDGLRATSDDVVLANAKNVRISEAGALFSGFNALDTSFRMNVTGDRYSLIPGDVEILRNGVALSSSQFAVQSKTVTIRSGLVEGKNTFEMKAYTSAGIPVFKTVELWGGSEKIEVSLVDANGKLITAPKLQLVAKLGDDQSISIKGTSKLGKVTLLNVPNRTIFLEVNQKGLYGFVGVTGNIGATTLILRKFGETTAVVTAATAGRSSSNVNQSVRVVPSISSPFSSAKSLPLAVSAAASGPSLLFGKTLATAAEGEVSELQMLKVPAGVSEVQIKYRFITSEVPGGYFGSQYNDYFRIQLRTASSTISESNSMNGLGLSAFDSAGATAERSKTLKVNPKGETIEISAAVANVADGLLDSSLEISVEAVVAQVSYQVSWDPKNGGLKVTWTAKSDISTAVPVEVFYSKAASVGDRLTGALYSFEVPAGTKAKASKIAQIPGAALTSAPELTSHVVVASSTTDFAALKDVSVSFSNTAESGVVSSKSRRTILDALRVAGQSTVVITSTLRRPEDQARAMFQNLTNPKFSIAQNIQNQLNLYANAGDQVIGVFQNMVQGLTLAQVLANAASIRQAMTDRIVSLANQDIRVSKHCVTPEKYALLNILDISRSSFTANNRGMFISALGTSGVAVLDEPSNNAIHLEIGQ